MVARRTRDRAVAVATALVTLGPVAALSRPSQAVGPALPPAPACATEYFSGIPTPDRALESLASSPDGRYLFTAVDAAGTGSIMRVDRVTDVVTTLLTSPGLGTARMTGAAADGSTAVFVTDLSLVPADTNGSIDAYAVDATTHAVELVGDVGAGAPSAVGSYAVDMTPDGRYVLFQAGGPSLAPGSSAVIAAVYVRDRVTHSTTRVTTQPAGQASAVSMTPTALSDDGRYVFYSSVAPFDGREVVLDRTTGVVAERSFFNELSADGLHGYLNEESDVKRVDLFNGTVEVLPRPSWASLQRVLAVSPNERYVLLSVFPATFDSDVIVLLDRQTNTFQPAGAPHGQGLLDVTLADDTTIVGFEGAGPGARVYASRPGLSTAYFKPSTVVQYTPTHLAIATWPGATVVFPPGVSVQWDPDHWGATVTVGAVSSVSPLPISTVGPGGCVADVSNLLTVTPAPPPPPVPVPVVTNVTGTRVVHRGEPFVFSIEGQQLSTGTSLSLGADIDLAPEPGAAGLSVRGFTLDAQPGYRDLVASNGPNASTTYPEAVVVREPVGEFMPVTPQRVYDTRQLYYGPSGAFGPGEERTVYTLGGPILGGVVAVVLNVTGIDPTSDTFLTLFPPDVARPLASNLNLRAGETAANLVTVGSDMAGRVRIYNNGGATHVALDIVGVYLRERSLGPQPASVFLPVTPERLLDTRVDFDRPLGTNEYIRMPVVKAGSPVRAVALNVTVTDTRAASFLSVVPAGANPLQSSNLNWTPGVTRPNLVVVPVSADGKVDIYNHLGNVNVIVDIVGLYDDGTLPIFEAQLGTRTPTRVLDTRDAGAKVVPGAPLVLSLDDLGVIPRSAIGVVMNVTVTDPDGAGYLTVFPDGVDPPLASNLNFTRGQTVANLVMVPVSRDGRVTFAAGVSATHVVADLVGWFAPANALPPDLAVSAARLEAGAGTAALTAGHPNLDGRAPAADYVVDEVAPVLVTRG